MLSESAFDHWAARVSLSDRGRALVTEIRNGDPARRPHSGPRHVAGRYPSRKMTRTIAYESRTVELRAIHRYEHDPSVEEFWDQPWALRLRYEGPRRGSVGPVHVPDFLVLFGDGVAFEEWKTEERLQHLAAKNPHRYQRDEGGHWTSAPAEEAALEFGLGYRVRTPAELSGTLTTNLEYLAAFFDDTEPAAAVRDRVRTAVAANPGLTIDELVGACGTGQDEGGSL
jgi:putative transposase